MMSMQMSQTGKRLRMYRWPARALRAAGTVALSLTALGFAPGVAGAQVPADLFTRACSIFTASPIFWGVSVNGVCSTGAATVTPGPKAGTNTVSATFTTATSHGSMSVRMDADPVLEFVFSTTNDLPGTQTYSVPLMTAIFPGQFTYATSSLSLSLTPALSGEARVENNPSLQGLFLGGYASDGSTITNLGVHIGAGPCTAGLTAVVCNYGTRTNTFAALAANDLRALLTYTQSGLGSTATFTGRVELLEVAPSTTVPEPSTYALMTLGLGIVGLIKRQRRAGS